MYVVNEENLVPEGKEFIVEPWDIDENNAEETEISFDESSPNFLVESENFTFTEGNYSYSYSYAEVTVELPEEPFVPTEEFIVEEYEPEFVFDFIPMNELSSEEMVFYTANWESMVIDELIYSDYMESVYAGDPVAYLNNVLNIYYGASDTETDIFTPVVMFGSGDLL